MEPSAKLHSATPHTESLGTGPELLMIHGWGMHSGVWHELAQRLAARHRVTLVDLPGHGHSPPSPMGEETRHYNFGWLVARIAEVAPPGCACLGWSLGGMVALGVAADYPELFSRLVVVGAGPRFVQGEGWPHAVEEAVLARFARDLEEDYRATLSRFLALQTRGAERAAEVLRLLRARLFAAGEPDLHALRGGLRLLREVDLREELDDVRIPTLLLTGERDTLFPPAAAEATAALLPDARAAILPGAGHAPFLSHPEAFVAQVEAFLGA